MTPSFSPNIPAFYEFIRIPVLLEAIERELTIRWLPGGFWYSIPARESLVMNMSKEQLHWMVKVFQPERTVAALPGAASLSEAACAALLDSGP